MNLDILDVDIYVAFASFSPQALLEYPYVVELVQQRTGRVGNVLSI